MVAQHTITDEQTLGALVADASRDLSALVRSEIDLAKAEMREDLGNGAKGGAMFGAAGVVGHLALVMFSGAAAYGLDAAGLHPGWAFLIVGGFYLLTALLLALLGKRAVSRIGPPRRAIRTTRDSVALLRNRGHDETAPRA